MHVRNWLIRPPFIMFYLTFLLPEVLTALEEAGFACETRAGLFAPPFDDHQLVIGTRA